MVDYNTVKTIAAWAILHTQINVFNLQNRSTNK